MKFKTWEKIYWGVVLVLIVISLIGIVANKGDVSITIAGKEEKISKGAAVGYSLLGFAIIFLPVWLLVRWIVNSNDKRERERERLN